MRQIVLDTETTGLYTEQGHRIIEIGCVELVNRKLTGNHYHQYINPQREIDKEAIAIHGITNEFLTDKPVFSRVASAFMEFITGAELIIHNAPFDVGFINYELGLLPKKWKSLAEYCHIIDTLVMAKQMHVGQRNSLDALCKRYTVDNSGREFHGALLDAHLLARVYLAMTGGQGTLFQLEETTEHNNQQATGSVVINTENRHQLRVVKASDEELQAHEKYLEMLAKQGKCVWRE